MKVLATQERGAQTALNAWKKVFAGGQHGTRNGATVSAYSTNGEDLWIACVPAGTTAPTEPASAVDESVRDYRLSAGDTFPLGHEADYLNDMYVRSPSGAQIYYNAWENVN